MASDQFKSKARALARSGHFCGLAALTFELRFEEGFHEAREWLALTSTKEELERLCYESRKRGKAALLPCMSAEASASGVKKERRRSEHIAIARTPSNGRKSCGDIMLVEQSDTWR